MLLPSRNVPASRLIRTPLENNLKYDSSDEITLNILSEPTPLSTLSELRSVTPLQVMALFVAPTKKVFITPRVFPEYCPLLLKSIVPLLATFRLKVI